MSALEMANTLGLSIDNQLIGALGAKEYAVASELLEKGASLSVRSPAGLTPLSCAFQDGQVDFLRLLVETYHVELLKCPSHTTVDLAAKYGHINVLEYFFSKCALKVQSSVAVIAATYGHLNILQYTVKCGIKPGSQVLLAALLCNKESCVLEIVKFLVVECACKPTSFHIESAIRSGFLEILQWLLSTCRFAFMNKHLETAVRFGQLDIVRHLVTILGYIPTGLHLRIVAEKGFLNIARYLVTERKCQPTSQHLSIAICEHQLDVVRYFIFENKCLPTGDHLRLAIQNGHINVVRWIVDDCHCTPAQEHLQLAVKHGYVDIARYLVVEKRCVPTFDCLNVTFSNMHYDMFKCLANTKFYIMNKHLCIAIRKGHFDIANFLITNNLCKPTSEHLVSAIQKGNLNIARGLMSKVRCKVTCEQLCIIIRHGPPTSDFVKWAVVNGCKPSGDHLDLAVKKYTPDIMVCLITEGGCKATKKHFNVTLERWRRHQGDIVKLLIIKGEFKPTSEDLIMAICEQCLDTVRCLVVEGQCKPINDHLDIAIANGSIQIVKYLVTECKCDLTNNYVNIAVSNGYLRILKFLVDEGCEVTSKHLLVAFHRLHYNIVKFLVVEGLCKPSGKFLDVVIANKQLYLVKFLVLDGGCKPTSDHVTKAIQTGNCDIVMWLAMEVGCKLTGEHLTTAIKEGRYTLGQKLVESKCFDPEYQVSPHKRNALHISCVAGQVGIVEQLLDKDSLNVGEKDGAGNTALHLACYHGHFATAQALLSTESCDLSSVNLGGRTPLDLTTKPNIIKELIKYGANPSNVYHQFGEILKADIQQPIEAAVKVFVTGDPSGGKSTLTKSLQSEPSRWTFRSQMTQGVDQKTAGIIPHNFTSGRYGSVTIYDLAGQREFYSSHAAILSGTIGSSPPIFLHVIDLRESDDRLDTIILYWMSFLRNQCFSVQGRPHLIIIGSHSDVLLTRGEIPKQKATIIENTLHKVSSPWFEYAGFVPMDCRYSNSSAIDALRLLLVKSCQTLRLKSTIQFNCHCLLVFLLSHFKEATAVTLQQVSFEIEKFDSPNEQHALHFVVPIPSMLYTMCEHLNARGHILLLKTKVLEDSWIILDQASILSDVIGTVFAPNGFKEHCQLASSTGVVQFTEFIGYFPGYNPNMLIRFLSHLEFCSEILDRETLELIDKHHSKSEQVRRHPAVSDQSLPLESPVLSSSFDQYFLFPGLILIDRPEHVWQSVSQFRFQCQWMLQCSSKTLFFSSRFLQVLLLRVIFSFALVLHKEEVDKSIPSLQRKCSIWRSGVSWGDRNGLEALVEVFDYRIVRLRMQSEFIVGECFSIRSSLIQTVLQAANEFCRDVPTVELFVSPTVTGHPLQPSTKRALFPLSEVAAAINSGKLAVVTLGGTVLSLESLLTFEPYAGLTPPLLQRLFGSEQEQIVSEEFLIAFTKAAYSKTDMLQKCFNVSDIHGSLHAKLGGTDSHFVANSRKTECFVLLQTWKNRSTHPTYEAFRRALDDSSIFKGRANVSSCYNSFCYLLDCSRVY